MIAKFIISLFSFLLITLTSLFSSLFDAKELEKPSPSKVKEQNVSEAEQNQRFTLLQDIQDKKGQN